METADNGCFMHEAFDGFQHCPTVVEATNGSIGGTNCFQNEPTASMQCTDQLSDCCGELRNEQYYDAVIRFAIANLGANATKRKHVTVEDIKSEIRKFVGRNRARLEQGITSWVIGLNGRGKPIDSFVCKRIACLRDTFESRAQQDEAALIQRYLVQYERCESSQSGRCKKRRYTYKKQDAESLGNSPSNPINENCSRKHSRARPKQKSRSAPFPIFAQQHFSQPYTSAEQAVTTEGGASALSAAIHDTDVKDEPCENGNKLLLDADSFEVIQEDSVVTTLPTSKDGHEATVKSPLAQNTNLFITPCDASFFDARDDTFVSGNDDTFVANRHLSPLSPIPHQNVSPLSENPVVQQQLTEFVDNEQAVSDQKVTLDNLPHGSDFQEPANENLMDNALEQSYCEGSSAFPYNQQQHQCQSSLHRQEQMEPLSSQQLSNEHYFSEQTEKNTPSKTKKNAETEGAQNANVETNDFDPTSCGTFSDTACAFVQSDNREGSINCQMIGANDSISPIISQHPESQQACPNAVEYDNQCQQCSAIAEIEQNDSVGASPQVVQNELNPVSISELSDFHFHAESMFPGSHLLVLQRKTEGQALVKCSGVQQSYTPPTPLSDFNTPNQLTPDGSQEPVSNSVSQQSTQIMRSVTPLHGCVGHCRSKSEQNFTQAPLVESSDCCGCPESPLMRTQSVLLTTPETRSQQPVFSGGSPRLSSYQQAQCSRHAHNSLDASLQNCSPPFAEVRARSSLCPSGFALPSFARCSSVPLLNQTIKPGDFLLEKKKLCRI